MIFAVTNSVISGNSDLYALSISAVVGAVVAVVATFGTQYYLNQPKIRGKIVQVVGGDFGMTPGPGNPNPAFEAAAHFIYAYLTNYHQSPIYLLDYELEIDYGQGFHRTHRIYGDMSSTIPNPLPTRFPGGQRLDIPNFGNHLLYKENKPVQYGDFVHGFLMFAENPSFRQMHPKKVRLTCIDVFGKKHILESSMDRLLDIPLFLEILREPNSWSIPESLFRSLGIRMPGTQGNANSGQPR